MIIQVIINLFFLIIGITMGSFFTLATYRIPLKQDITHTRSYCPKCNHRLEFLDLIPVLSYVFLGRKCRYCKEKISARYISMEIFSGVLYLLIVKLLKINFINISMYEVARLVYVTLMYAVIFILVGILKETKTLSKETLMFGIATQVVYIIYLYIIKASIYRYIIYLIILCILLLISKIIKNRSRNEFKKG